MTEETCLYRTLLNMVRKLSSRLRVRWGSYIFGIGVMNYIFAAGGKARVFKERLNSLVTTGVIVASVALSMWAKIPSGPLAFVTSWD